MKTAICRGMFVEIAERLATTACLCGDHSQVSAIYGSSGVFARSLTECLAIQLAQKDRLDPAMQALLDNLELGQARLCVAEEDLVVSTMRTSSTCWPRSGHSIRVRSSFESGGYEAILPECRRSRRLGRRWLVE